MKTAVMGSLIVPALLGCLLSGCSSTPSSKLPVVPSTQVGQTATEEKGVIVDVRDVLIQAPPPIGGARSTGATVGRAVGAAAASGSPVAIAGAVGGIIGGSVGAKTEEKMGEEITIELEGGKRIVVVQERGEVPLAPGEEVRVLTTSGVSGGIYRGGIYGGGGTTRVVRAPQFVSVVGTW